MNKQYISEGALCAWRFFLIEKRLSPLYPRLTLRIAKGSSSAVQVSGAKTDEERESVMSILREIWEDDSWLPE
ncbi:DinI family protein [Salmonella enterica subsp. enterica serovar Typhimurium]|nr:DinI family protein [Salmonella enterica]EBH1209722.1 DinI family protein [Salmonella enterica]EBS3043015.1 DinI family protein [Salmonella enterica subsp. enterica serovar Java]EBX2272140.1 DinI family protein [Salmonella enterica subsp. enterica serovar Typhimurium]